MVGPLGEYLKPIILTILFLLIFGLIGLWHQHLGNPQATTQRRVVRRRQAHQASARR